MASPPLDTDRQTARIHYSRAYESGRAVWTAKDLYYYTGFLGFVRGHIIPVKIAWLSAAPIYGGLNSVNLSCFGRLKTLMSDDILLLLGRCFIYSI